MAPGQTAWKHNTAMMLVTRPALPSLKDLRKFRGEKPPDGGILFPWRYAGPWQRGLVGTFFFLSIVKSPLLLIDARLARIQKH